MIKVYFSILAFLFGAHTVVAQVQLKGKVRDVAGESLPGVSVYIRGTSAGTFTDAEGTYSLSIPASYRDSTLVFSMVGFANKQVKIGNNTVLDITLDEDALALAEVVVTGYSTQEKDKITGSVATVSAEALVKVPVPSIDQALQGRAPGVVVSQNTGAPGEGVSVRIRGVGSVNSGNYPLYIVDGVPTLDIANFPTQDIESISILKDASAAALYGARAANGVVIVTTKSGKSKTPVVSFSTQTGIQQPSRLIKMANTRDYVSIYNEAAANDNAGKTNPIFLRPLISDELAATLPDVNYVDAIMRDAVLQTHSISISGQENTTQYFISANYFGQEGIIKGSDYNRISGRVNLKTDVKSWLRTGLNVNLSKSETDLIGSSGDGAGGNGGSVVRYAFFRTPAIPIYDANGDFTDKPERFDFFGDGYSPVGMLAYNRNKRALDQVFGKAFLDIDVLKNLKLTSTFGFDINHVKQRRFDRNWGTDLRINNPNQLTVVDTRNNTYTWTNLLTYIIEKDDYNVTVLAGTEAIRVRSEELIGNERQFPDQTDNLVYLGNGLGQKVVDENTAGNALLSFFGRIDYDYKGRYNAAVTVRRDGSSRFGSENRWGNFYAASLGWRIDREAFMLDNRTFDKLFLRAGYGRIGNQEIGNYAYNDMIGSGYNYVLGDTRANGYAVSALGNANVRWESSNQLNAGVDIAVLDSRLEISLDVFDKVTSDLLVKQPIASSAGQADAPWVNNGKVRNRGLELAAAYSDAVGNLNYTVSANGALLQNEVLDVTTPIPGGAIGSDRIIMTEEGYPVGSFYMYEMEGVFQNNAQIFTHAYQGRTTAPGDVMYKDQNGDGLIDANDRAHVGSAIPKVTAGLNVSLGYRGWDLSLFFQGAYGQKIFSVLNRDIEGFYRAFNVTQRYFDNRWTGEGTSNEYPRASWDASGNNTKFSTRFLEDGSYTRLKNLQLGYSFSSDLLSKLRLNTVRIYFSATNLLTFSKYSGMDPEMTVSDNSKGEGDRANGMDWGTYPSAKSYNLGLNISF